MIWIVCKIRSFERGPEPTIKSAQKILNLPFLDSTHFESFEFAFGKPNFFMDRELITIHFKSSKSINILTNYKGVVLIDSQSHAIINIDYTETIQFPLLIRPILHSLIGFKLNDITKTVRLNYQEMNGNWYPKTIKVKYTATPTKRHLFKKNEQAFFAMEQLLNINDINILNPKPIPDEHLYKPTENLEAQLFNPNELTWDDVSISR